jgi:hypothetical protein
MLRLAAPQILIAVAFLVRLGSGLCPSQCQCDEANLRSDCSESRLEIVPIFLNPRTKSLTANQVPILSKTFFPILHILYKIFLQICVKFLTKL